MKNSSIFHTKLTKYQLERIELALKPYYSSSLQLTVKMDITGNLRQTKFCAYELGIQKQKNLH